jgi:diaminopimelate epimerase
MKDSALQFWKYQGLGNDFVVVEQPITPQEARLLCDRKFGVGGDGVLQLDITDSRPAGCWASVHVWNADGSAAEICGNGLRCTALHLHDKGLAAQETFALGTGDGPRQCVVVETPGRGQAVVQVEMGPPRLQAAAVPHRGTEPMVESPLAVGQRTLALTALSMGNPHAVTFGEFSSDDVAHLGPLLEGHDHFPAGVNAGFAQLTGADRLQLTVWERGAGLTGACGSGACAAAVAACLTERAPCGRPLHVDQPGGRLTIVVTEGQDNVLMTGPARWVFTGSVELSQLEARPTS